MRNDIKNFIPRNIEDKTLLWLLEKYSYTFRTIVLTMEEGLQYNISKTKRQV